MASLGWLSSGAATEGVTPIYSEKKLATFFSHRQSASSPVNLFTPGRPFLLSTVTLLLISLGCHPLGGCHPGRSPRSPLSDATASSDAAIARQLLLLPRRHHTTSRIMASSDIKTVPISGTTPQDHSSVRSLVHVCQIRERPPAGALSAVNGR